MTQLLSIYQKEMKKFTHKTIYILIFIAALLVITSNWKQAGHPSAGEWINKLCHIHIWNTTEK